MGQQVFAEAGKREKLGDVLSVLNRKRLSPTESFFPVRSYSHLTIILHTGNSGLSVWKKVACIYFYEVYTVYAVYTMYTVYKVYILYTVYTVYNVHSALE